MVAVFDLVNNHNYVNSNEFKLTAQTTVEHDTNNLERQLLAKGLVWLNDAPFLAGHST
jgi:hypothetical protein